MAQKMAVKERNASDNGIGEIHHQVNISLDWNIHRVQPFRTFEFNSVLGVDEEVYPVGQSTMDAIRFFCGDRRRLGAEAPVYCRRLDFE